MTHLLPILLALAIHADHALEIFTLPQSCPDEVPTEAIFQTPGDSNVFTRITQDHVSAFYASLTALWERMRWPNVIDKNHVYGQEPISETETRSIDKPLSWWCKNGDLSWSYDLDFFHSRLSPATNRVINSRRIFNAEAMAAGFAALRNVNQKGSAFKSWYSSRIPSDSVSDTGWSDDLFAALGVASETKLWESRWPTFSLMTNDWFVTQANDPLDMPDPPVMSFVSLFGSEIRPRISSVSFARSVFDPVFPTNALPPVVTNDIRRISRERLAAFNLATAAIDRNYYPDIVAHYETDDFSQDGWTWNRLEISEHRTDVTHDTDVRYDNDGFHLSQGATTSVEVFATTNVTKNVVASTLEDEAQSLSLGNASHGSLTAGFSVFKSDILNAFTPTSNEVYDVTVSTESYSRRVAVTIVNDRLGTVVGSYYKQPPTEFTGYVDVSLWSQFSKRLMEQGTNRVSLLQGPKPWQVADGLVASGEFAAFLVLNSTVSSNQTESSDAPAETNRIAKLTQCIGPVSAATTSNAVCRALYQAQGELVEKAEDLIGALIAQPPVGDLEELLNEHAEVTLDEGPIATFEIRLNDEILEINGPTGWSAMPNEYATRGCSMSVFHDDDTRKQKTAVVTGHCRGIMTVNWKFPNLYYGSE